MKKTAGSLVVVPTVFMAILIGQFKSSLVAARLVESPDSKVSEESIKQQSGGLEALKTGNVEIFANLTAEEAVFVDAAGPATKAEVVRNVAGFTLTDYSMEDVRFVPLSAESGLISYKIHEKGVSHGHEFAAQAYISSIWAERAGKWFCLFSQETPARMPPKQPN
jgi:hypothetical protein